MILYSGCRVEDEASITTGPPVDPETFRGLGQGIDRGVGQGITRGPLRLPNGNGDSDGMYQDFYISVFSPAESIYREM